MPAPCTCNDAFLAPAKVRAWQRAWLEETRRSARHWGTFLELERPQRIVFTWITDPSEEADPSVVRLTLPSARHPARLVPPG